MAAMLQQNNSKERDAGPRALRITEQSGHKRGRQYNTVTQGRLASLCQNVQLPSEHSCIGSGHGHELKNVGGLPLFVGELSNVLHVFRHVPT